MAKKKTDGDKKLAKLLATTFITAENTDSPDVGSIVLHLQKELPVSDEDKRILVTAIRAVMRRNGLQFPEGNSDGEIILKDGDENKLMIHALYAEEFTDHQLSISHQMMRLANDTLLGIAHIIRDGKANSIGNAANRFIKQLKSPPLVDQEWDNKQMEQNAQYHLGQLITAEAGGETPSTIIELSDVRKSVFDVLRPLQEKIPARVGVEIADRITALIKTKYPDGSPATPEDRDTAVDPMYQAIDRALTPLSEWAQLNNGARSWFTGELSKKLNELADEERSR